MYPYHYGPLQHCFPFIGVSWPRGSVGIVEAGTMHQQLKQTLMPSPRAVSNAIIADNDNPSNDYTLLVMQWGQFVDHDITFTPLTKGFHLLNYFKICIL